MVANDNSQMQRWRILRIAVGITMLVLLLAGNAGASTLTVNASGGANYTRIQDAIDNASVGDTILVYNGTYYENVNVTKQLTLRGIGMPVVNASGSGNAIMLAADGIILEGYATGAYWAGITVISSNNTMSDNNASNNHIGIHLYYSHNNILIGNNASNNDGVYDDEACASNGISLDHSNNNTLIDNNANWNRGIERGCGINLKLSNNNNLSNNNANSNNFMGIHISSSNNNKLINNNANINGIGLYLSYESVSGSMSQNNMLIGNKVMYNLGSGIVFDSLVSFTGITYYQEANSILDNNTISNNVEGIHIRSKKVTLTNNNISYNTNGGIHIETYMGRFGFVDDGENTLNNNIVSNNGNGIYLWSSSNILTGNNASNNTDSGIYIETYCDICSSAGYGGNTLNYNSILNNGNGISFKSSRNNTVMGNNIKNNDNGIILNNSDNNLFYNNIFGNINNANNNGNNTWNTTKTSGTNIVDGSYLAGNLWAYPDGTGFSQTCSDVNSDGICDDPYVLDGNNIDYLPLSFSYIPLSISFINPTPANGATVNQNYANINTTVSDSSTAFIDWNLSLAGWWRFNNESDETPSFFRDSSSWGNNGTCSGVNCPSFTYGKFGNALNFDGINDYVDAGNGASLNIIDAITIEIWINPSLGQEKCWDGVSGNYGVMSKVSAPNNSVNWSWQLKYGAPGGGCYLGFQFNGNPEGPRWVTVKQNLTAGHWYHVVGTFNGTDINLYLNGNLMDTNKISAIKGYRNRLLIGNDGWANLFNGKIDEVRIHKRALSPEEIKASYNAGINRLYRNFTGLTGGTYNYQAYAQNLAGAVNKTETRTLTIGSIQGAPAITSFSPASPVNDIAGAIRPFNITLNQNVNVNWSINGTPVQSNASVIGAIYTNSSSLAGTWIVNATATNHNGTVSREWVWTVTSEFTPIQITNPSANPAIILNDNGRARPPGTNITRLNVTVTGNVASVSIDLSSIGGSASAPMIKISGKDIYSITTNATAGINLTNDLVVNVTDTIGNFNNSVGIPVTVLLRGDIVRDNKIDLKDLLYMRRFLAGLEPSINTIVADIQQAEGDGNVDLKDLLYLRRYLAGLEPLI